MWGGTQKDANVRTLSHEEADSGQFGSCDRIVPMSLPRDGISPSTPSFPKKAVYKFRPKKSYVPVNKIFH